MPAVPGSLLEPVWEQFVALLPERPAVVPTHPLGCHRRRIPDRVVFEHVVTALAHGSGYERLATPGCSDRTIRRRVRDWAEAGLAQPLHTLVVEQDDRMIGLDLDDVAVDGCITKAPCGGEKAGRSPVDWGKRGLKRSTLTDGTGVPLHVVAAEPTDTTPSFWCQRWRGWRCSGHGQRGSPRTWTAGTTAPARAPSWRDSPSPA